MVGMTIRRFQDLIAWQLSRELERKVFAFTDRPVVRRDSDFCDQIRRSSASPPRNMAEGFGRFWPAEFAHKLHIAVGELEETQDHLDKALEQNYIDDEEHIEMYALADRAVGASTRFIQYLDGAGKDWKKEYFANLREKFRQRRAQRAAARGHAVEGTHDPEENREPKERGPEPRNQNPQRVMENQNQNQNQNQNENENENQNQNQRTRTGES
jgi:four helix bundle protein